MQISEKEGMFMPQINKNKKYSGYCPLNRSINRDIESILCKYKRK